MTGPWPSRTRDEVLAAVGCARRHERARREPGELAAQLYGGWYARPLDAPVTPDNFPTDLVQVLRAADATGRAWDEGWTADRVAGDGRVIARRSGEVRMADRCDYVARGAVGVLPSPGQSLVLAGRRDRVDPDGSWWRTGGRTWRFTRPVPGLVRLYWNTRLGHLPALVERLTSALRDDERPWMLKCAVDPAVHARSDATVLYVPRQALDELAPLVDAVAAELAPHARVGAPPLTLPLHPGVAVAADPAPAESFGEHRCRLIAEALAADLPDDDDAALAVVAAHMDAAGIDLARPHALRADPPLPWER